MNLRPKLSDIIASLVATLIWWLASYLLGRLLFKEESPFTATLVASLCILMAGVLIIALGVFYYKKGQLAFYPPVPFHWKIIEKSISYEIDDSGILHFSRTTKARALTNNIDRYVDKFLWTGGKTDIPTSTGDVESSSQVVNAGIWTIFECKINRSLRKGEVANIVNIWPQLDNWRSSDPFVSTSADSPTEKIVFDIRIPDCFRSSDRVIIEEMRSIESILPFKTEERKFEGMRFRYEVSPSLFRHFRIRWAWAGNEEPDTISKSISRSAGDTDG